MGSPIASVLAILSLGHYENLWLNELKCPSVHFYHSYVDDTFCLFNNDHNTLFFFECLNSKHDNIKFTMKKETSYTLALLDAFINNRQPTNLITSVYRRKTFTWLLTNFHSFTSFSCKLGLISTLTDRAYKVNNILLGFNKEVSKSTFLHI